MIVTRYLNKEIIVSMLATTCVLLTIFICNQFVRYLGDAAIGRVTAQAVIQLMLIQVPLLSGFMLPLGYYIAVLLSYGRIHADSEMTVLFCCGMSRFKLLCITLIGASVVATMVAILMIWIEPNMAWYRDHILAKAAVASPVEKMAPGRFHMVGKRWVFFVGSISRDHDEMQKVFVAELPSVSEKNNAEDTVLVADSAKQIQDSAGNRFIEFQNGARYIGSPGQADLEVVSFGNYGIRIPEQKIHMSKLEEFTATRELWRERHTNHLAAAELQWRLSMPLSVLILTLFALPLSSVRPRQGKFARFLPAIIVYTIYIDGLYVAQSWVQKGLVNPSLGMWWVHGVMFVLGMILCVRYVKERA